MMGIRYQYLHLMHMGKEEVGKSKGKDRKSSRGEQMIGEEFGAEGEDGDNEEDYDDEDDGDELDEDMEAGVASEDGESDDDVDEDPRKQIAH
jgi:hypothetical protein